MEPRTCSTCPSSSDENLFISHGDIHPATQTPILLIPSVLKSGCNQMERLATSVGQSEGLGQTNNHNQHKKGLQKGEWWCASTVPEGIRLWGGRCFYTKGMMQTQTEGTPDDEEWWKTKGIED